MHNEIAEKCEEHTEEGDIYDHDNDDSLSIHCVLSPVVAAAGDCLSDVDPT